MFYCNKNFMHGKFEEKKEKKGSLPSLYEKVSKKVVIFCFIWLIWLFIGFRKNVSSLEFAEMP